MNKSKGFAVIIILTLLLSQLAVLEFGFVSTAKANPTYEDFTGYTEYDGNNHIGLVGTNHVDFNAYRNEDAWLYKDKGAAHFGTSFTHLIDLKAITHLANGEGAIWALSNYVDDIKYFMTSPHQKNFYAVEIGFYNTYYYVFLEEQNGASWQGTGAITLTVSTQYYLKIVKSGTSLTLYVYSDAARTTQIAGSPVSLTVTDNSFQYIFAADTYNSGTASNTIDVDIDNLDLQEFTPTNDACDSSATFTSNVDGWVNMTVTDVNLVANLYTVDIQVNTTGDAQTFTLRWTQSSNTFSEVSDSSGICTLSASSIRVNIDADTDKIAFMFEFTGGTLGYCDIKAVTTDDTSLTDTDTYSNKFLFTLITDILWVDRFDNTNVAWLEVGGSPYLNNSSDNYICNPSANAVESWFRFEPTSKSVQQAILYIQGCEDLNITVTLNNGVANYTYDFYFAFTTEWKNVNVTNAINSQTKANNAKMSIKANEAGTLFTEIIRCYIKVFNGPVYGDVLASDQRAEHNCTFSVLLTDPDGMSSYAFNHNASGSWLPSNITGSLSGKQAWSNETITLPSNSTIFISVIFYANDTLNNWENTSVQTFPIISKHFDAECMNNVGVTGVASSTQHSLGRNNFYIEPLELYIQIWSNGTHEVYSVTSDGITWNFKGAIRQRVEGIGCWYSYYEYRNGINYLHYMYADEFTTNLYYRRCVINPNGTLTFPVAEQVVAYIASLYQLCPNGLGTDPSGHVFLAYYYCAVTKQGAINVTYSSATDGTWTTQSGYPKTVTPIVDEYEAYIVPLLDDWDAYVVFQTSKEATRKPQGRMIDNNVLQSIQNVSEHFLDYGRKFSVVSDSSGNVHYVYIANSTLDIEYSFWNYTSKSWTIKGETVCQETSVSGANSPTYPIISFDYSLNHVIVNWFTEDQCLVITKEAQWQPKSRIFVVPDGYELRNDPNVLVPWCSHTALIGFHARSITDDLSYEWTYLYTPAYSTFIIDSPLTITTSLSPATKSDFTLTITQSITPTFSLSLLWNSLLTLQTQPSITLTQVSKTDFTLTISSSISNSFTETEKTDYKLNPSNPITATFTSAPKTDFALIFNAPATSTFNLPTIQWNALLNIQATPTITYSAITESDFTILVSSPITPTLTPLPQWDTAFTMSNSITITLVLGAKSDFVISTSNPISSTLSTALRTTFNLSPETSITISLTKIGKTDFVLQINNPNTISLSSLLGWTTSLTTSTSQTISFTQASKTDFALTFNSQTTSTFNLPVIQWNAILNIQTTPTITCLAITKSDFTILVSNPITPTLTPLPQWNTAFILPNPIIVTPVLGTKNDFVISTSNPISTGWTLNTVANFILNIPETITNTLSTALQTTFTLSPTTSMSISLAEVGKADFTLTIGTVTTTTLDAFTPKWDATLNLQHQPTVTLTPITKTDFMLTFSNPIGTSWTLDIIHTPVVTYIVDLACSISSSFGTAVQSILNIVIANPTTMSFLKVSQTDFVLAIQTSATPQFSLSTPWNTIINSQLRSSITFEKISQSTFTLTIDNSLIPTFAMVPQWNTVATMTNPIIIELSKIVKGDFTITINSPITSSLTESIKTDFTTSSELQPSITFEKISQTNFLITINNSVTTNWLLNIIQTSVATYIVDLSASITAGFETVKQWFASIIITAEPSIVITATAKSDFIISINNSVATSWSISIFHGIIVDLSTSITTSLGTVRQWIANIVITAQPSVTLTQATKSDFTITFSNPVTSGWSITALIPSAIPSLPEAPSWFPAKITLFTRIINVLASVWQFTWTQEVPVSVNVTIVNESPYTSGTLHYQIVNLDTNKTVIDWTLGKSVLIDAEGNTTLTITEMVPIQRNFASEHFRINVKLSLIQQVIEASADFEVQKDMVKQFYSNTAILGLCVALVGIAVYSYTQKPEPWKKYPTEQKRKKYPKRK